MLFTCVDSSLLQLELTSNKFRYLGPVLKSIEELSKEIDAFDQETKIFEKVSVLLDLKRGHLCEFLKKASDSREKVAFKMLETVGGQVGGLAKSA
jgi:hypothetical protein